MLKSDTTDTRIVYGARCVWWDGIEKIGKTPAGVGPTAKMGGLPCCPHCGGVLFEMDSPKRWWDGVAKHEANGNPGYRAFIEWLKGKCFPTMDDAKAAYERRAQS